MQFFKQNRSKVSLKGNAGFSLVEIIVVILIVSILSSIAIPRYLATKNKAYLQTALSDGGAMYQELTNVFADTIPDFGSTNGTIVYTPATNTVTVVLGVGAVSPGTFIEILSNSTTATGVTYAATLNWCLDVANNGQHAIYTQDGAQYSMLSCP